MSVALTDFWGDAVDVAPLVTPDVPFDFDTDATDFTDVELNPNYAQAAYGASVSSDTQPTGANAVIDGDGSTAWVGGSLDEGERFTIDLGAVQTINLLRLVQGATPQVDQASTVLIEFSSDGTSWGNIGSFAGIPDPIDPGGDISARYWRFTDLSGAYWHPVDGWTVYSVEIGVLSPVDPTDPEFSSPYVDSPTTVGWKTGWLKIDYSGIGTDTPTINLDVSSSDVLMILWERVGSDFVEVDRVREGTLDETLYAGVFYVEISFRGLWQGPPFTVVGTFTSTTVTDGGGGEPPPGPPHDIAYRVEILYDEDTDITGICSVANSSFDTMANGQVGTCEIWVEDLDHDQVFVVGKPLALKIDGAYEWRGFVASVSRRYAFPVVNTVGVTPVLVPRWQVIRGSDVNILFSKRVVYNKADPTKQISYYPAGAHDDTIIADLVENYLDLTDDGLDTSSGVVHVGESQIDNTGAPFSPAQTWGEAMRLISVVPAALWYIDPDKVLRYVSLETATAPWAVSDHPDGTLSYGMREVVVLNDGTSLANEAFVWGAGKGDADEHFAHYENALSQETHGLWQWSDHRLNDFKEASLLRRATTYVEGEASSGRGHKDDLVGAEFVIFRAGLRVGMILTVQVLAFDFNLTLPIRAMRISFPASQGVDGDGHFMSFVRYWVSATNVYDEAWAGGDRPQPTNVRPPPPGCQFVPRSEACTGEGWAAAFYDPFDRTWTKNDPWGDGGCGAWGNATHTLTTGTQWVDVGPGPWCIVYASNGAQDVSFDDSRDTTRPAAENRSFSVSVTAQGHVFAEIMAQDQGTNSKTVDLAWGAGYAYYLRVRRVGGYLFVKVWKQSGEIEPDAETIAIPEVFGSSTVAGFKADFVSPMAGDIGLTTTSKPGRLAISTSNGRGWVYYNDAWGEDGRVPTYGLDFVSTFGTVWSSRFWPAGTFPVNPDIVGAVQPIDAICTSLGVPLFDRGDGGDHADAGAFNTRKLYDLHWAWNSDNGLSGTTQADGRMIVRDHYYAPFRAPRGATSVTITGKAYINAPETGIFSLGSQPGPSGEGAITFEIWDVDPAFDGTGSDTADPTHSSVISSSVSDYTYKDGDGGPVTEYQSFSYSRSISAGETFQLGGKITNTDGDLINSHGPTSSFAVNSGGRRVLELKIFDVAIKFDWMAQACGPTEPNVAGFQQQAVNCNTNTLFCEAPKWKSGNQYELLRDYVNNSPIVYYNGARLTIKTDYVLDDATAGLVTITAIPSGDQTDHLSVCYAVRDLQVFELPKADPKFNKHPGYVAPVTPPPGYHPHFVPQFGWGTIFDSVNCTCASAAMYLDAVTGGSQRATPPQIRAAQSDQSGGIGLDDAADALATYGVTLHVHTNTFAAFSAALDVGPVMIAGTYGQIPPQYNSDLPFTGGHSMMALCWSDSRKAVLVYDPLGTASMWMPSQVIRNYMEDFGGGSCEYGATV